MESIKFLSQIPESLLRAHNVAYIVIDGLRLDKRVLIEKAQRDAEILIENKEYLSREGIEKLENILAL
jgi:hypothetical protein